MFLWKLSIVLFADFSVSCENITRKRSFSILFWKEDMKRTGGRSRGGKSGVGQTGSTSNHAHNTRHRKRGPENPPENSSVDESVDDAVDEAPVQPSDNLTNIPGSKTLKKMRSEDAEEVGKGNWNPKAKMHPISSNIGSKPSLWRRISIQLQNQELEERDFGLNFGNGRHRGFFGHELTYM